MKKFLLNIIGFLFVLFLINILFFIIGYYIYFRGYQKSITNQSYTSFLISDSHGEVLLDLTEKFGVYNFSSGGDSYVDMQRKVNYLINNIRVDTIYITVDDHTLSPYKEIYDNNDRSIIYTSFQDYKNKIEFFKYKYLKYYITLSNPKVGELIKIYLKGVLSKIIKASKNKSIHIKEWKSLDPSQKYESVKKESKKFDYITKSNLLKQSLIDIIEICKEQKVILIGVKFPVTAEYYNVFNKKSFGADSIFYESNINVRDFSNLYFNNEEFFRDHDHLNQLGSDNFIKQLTKNK